MSQLHSKTYPYTLRVMELLTLIKKASLYSNGDQQMTKCRDQWIMGYLVPMGTTTKLQYPRLMNITEEEAY